MPALEPTSPKQGRTLADEQARFVRALVLGENAPAGFDADRFEATAQGLFQKRRRELLHAWPQLIELLGTSLHDEFLAYALKAPLPSVGGPIADGRLFVEFLASRVALSDQIKLVILRFDLHYSRVSGGFVPRKGASIRFAYLNEERRGIVGIRQRWLGERIVKTPRIGVTGNR